MGRFDCLASDPEGAGVWAASGNDKSREARSRGINGVLDFIFDPDLPSTFTNCNRAESLLKILSAVIMSSAFRGYSSVGRASRSQ